MPAITAEARRGAVHKPCVFNPNGADEDMCKRLSASAQRTRCESSGCKSKWRVKPAATSATSVRAQPLRTREPVVRKTPVVVPPPSTPVAKVDAPPPVDVSTPEETPKVVAPPMAPAVALPTPPPPVEDEGDTGEWRDVLQRVKEAMAGAELVRLHPRAIRPMPGQPRVTFSELAMENLRTSIREVGQIQAGIVRAVDDGIDGITHELLDGERRWRAVSAEDLDVYRAQLVEIDDEAAPYMIAAIANFNREGHTPVEVSDAIHHMRTGTVKFPMSAIAELFGFSEHWTYQMHGLQRLHADVRAMLDPNQPRHKILGVTAAIQISKLDAELQPDLARKVLSKEVSVRGLRAEVVRTGEDHGSPVRTREQRPSKVVESYVSRSGELARAAQDLLARVHEMQEREIVPLKTSNRGNLALNSVRAAARDIESVLDIIARQ